jgi:hypothetical protein
MAKVTALKKKAPAPAPREIPHEIPKGYWQNAEGALVHQSLVKDVDRARDELVKSLVAMGKQQSERLSEFKRDAMEAIATFVELSAQSYDVKLGGNKGNVTLFSFDGRYKVMRAIQERMEFDERLQAARALIDECMADWSKNARYEIKALISRAFDVDKEGKVNVGKVLALRRVDIKDERWQRAMQALGEALQVVGSKSYIRLYERDGNGQYQPIPLDVAGA